jgi:uncharacterized protein
VRHDQAQHLGLITPPALRAPIRKSEVMIPPLSVANPCINICRMDLAGRYCQGCGRTLLEIGRWDQLTEAQRAEVMTSLPARLPRRSDQSLPLARQR